MYKNILAEIQNVDTYGVFSLLVFFIFFTSLLIYVFTMKSARVERMKQIPLDEITSLNNAQNEIN